MTRISVLKDDFAYSIDCPFDKVATRDVTRRPQIALNPDLRAWLDREAIDYQIDFLFGYEQMEWKVKFTFASRHQMILFKLTHG